MTASQSSTASVVCSASAALDRSSKRTALIEHHGGESVRKLLGESSRGHGYEKEHGEMDVAFGTRKAVREFRP